MIHGQNSSFTQERNFILWMVLAVLFLVGLPASAATVIEVPADQPTIQGAIDVAVNGDTVRVAPGTYFENINFLGKAITVESSGGAALTTIDGGSADSVVIFTNGEGRSSVLDGFTLTNGSAGVSGGGGIRMQSASPIIRNNDIVHNVSCTSGGGIKVNFSSPLIEGNFIAHNGQSGCSGGSGGGLYVGGAASAEIVGNVIAQNFWRSGAGVSFFAAGTPTLKDNVITGNVASSTGGGVALVNRSDALIVQNLIFGNSAGEGGGIYWLVPSSGRGPFLVNNTIAFNSSAQGSGVAADGFDIQAALTNNIIVANPGQTAVFCGDFNDLNAPTFTNNNVYSATGAAYGGICVDQTGSNGNLSADPLFVNPASDDYHLQSASPSIDAGENLHPDLPAEDIDGEPRVFDGDGDAAAVVDQGYDEFFVANTPPEVSITAPADSTRIGVGDSVTLSGTASDAEDGDLSAALSWSSDLDGTIGSGASFSTTALSAGTHLITASVVDSAGEPDSDAITLIVKVPIQLVLTSIGVEDGWVRESSETSEVGGLIRGDVQDRGIRVGDNNKDRQFRGVLSFDTSAIPAGALLRSATVRLRRSRVFGTNPFSTHGTLTVDARSGGWSGSTALQKTDFEAAATAQGVATLSDAPTDGAWSEGALDTAGLAVLDPAGTTQLRLAFALDDNDDRSRDILQYHAGESADPANRPQLVLEYLD